MSKLLTVSIWHKRLNCLRSRYLLHSIKATVNDEQIDQIRELLAEMSVLIAASDLQNRQRMSK